MAEYAISFDASSNQYITTDLAPVNDDFEIELKIKFGSVATSEPHKFVFGNYGSQFYAYHHKWDGLKVKLSLSGGGASHLLTGAKYSADDEVTLRITYTKGGTFALYEDDVLAESVSVSDVYGSDFGSMTIGAVDNPANSTRDFDGEIHYFKYTDNADSSRSRHYEFNEGAGLVVGDSLETPDLGANDGTLTGFVGDDSQWILISGGGAENYSGVVLSIATAISNLVGHKNAFGVVSQNETIDGQVSGTKSTTGASSSSHTANTLISAAKKAATLLSSSNIVTSSVQAIGHRLASLVSSVTPQSENSGKKKGFSALVSSIVTGTSVSATTQRGGVIASSNTVATLIGAGESLLEVYGYAVSSNVPTTLVNGFKAALGAASTIQTAQSSVQGKKQGQGFIESESGTATSLLAFAARAGWIESVGVARTFVTGMNPEANIPKRRYSITVTRPGISYVCHRNSQLTYRAVI